MRENESVCVCMCVSERESERERERVRESVCVCVRVCVLVRKEIYHFSVSILLITRFMSISRTLTLFQILYSPLRRRGREPSL